MASIESNFSGYKFYIITYKGKRYIGELSPNTEGGDYMKYHISRINLPFFNHAASLPEAWEGKLSDNIRENGFKSELNNFTECVSYDAVQVINNMRASLDEYAKGTFFEGKDIFACLYAAVAKVNTEIKPIENLLINLLYKEDGGNIWNTHANYGSFKNVQGWNLNIESLQKLQKQAIDSRISLTLSVDVDQARPFLDKSHLENFLSKHISATTIPVRITGGNVSQFNNLIGRKISMASLEKLQKILESYWDSLSDDLKNDEITKQYAALQNEVSTRLKILGGKQEQIKIDNKNKPKNKRLSAAKTNIRDTKDYQTWLKAFDNLTTKIQKQQISLMNDDVLGEFITLINSWITNVNLSDILSTPTDYQPKMIENYYKKTMTQWIQKNIFDRYTQVDEYTQKQIDIYLKTPRGQKGQAWLPSSSTYQQTLKESTEQLWPSECKYILKNWYYANVNRPSMYGEQVSIWLGTKAPFGLWHDLIHAFSNQPQSIDDLDRITFF